MDEQKRIDAEKNTRKVLVVLGEIGLKFLERMMHRSKLWSLKFHNVSNVWFQTIREKRQRGAQIQKELLEQREQIAMEASKNESANAESAQVVSATRKILRPMVSAGVTMPQSRQVRMKEKNKLEDALIKRIAVNPKDIEAYERLGDYYLESENFQDSLECFKQVLRLSPTHQKARLRIRRLERLK